MLRLLPALLTLVTALSIPGALPASAASPAPLEGLPRYDHVVVLVEENESIDKTYAAPSYIHTVSTQGAFADHYYGIGHNSLDNYIAMLSGQPDQPSSGSDCLGMNLYTCVQFQQAFSGGKNLADQLDVAGVSWRGYMDGNTLPCQHADYAPTAGADTWQGAGATPPSAGKDYADRHNPFLYFADIVGDDARCQAHVRPYTDLAGDIAANAVPQFGFITPDTCHDGHDATCSGGAPGGLTSANAWLQSNLPPLLSYLNTHNGLLLLTTDESAVTDTSGCCTGGAGAPQAHVGTMGFGGRVGLVALGPGVRAGQTVATPYDHASLLRTIESLFGISEHLNNAATASAMTDLFAATTAPAGPASDTSGSAAGGRAGVTPGTSRGLPAAGLALLLAGLALAVAAAAWAAASRFVNPGR